MAKSKKQTFYVNGRLALEVCIPIVASSLEDAIQQSQDLKETDFVEILGVFNDGEMKISGVFEEYTKLTV